MKIYVPVSRSDEPIADRDLAGEFLVKVARVAEHYEAGSNITPAIDDNYGVYGKEGKFKQFEADCIDFAVGVAGLFPPDGMQPLGIERFKSWGFHYKRHNGKMLFKYQGGSGLYTITAREGLTLPDRIVWQLHIDSRVTEDRLQRSVRNLQEFVLCLAAMGIRDFEDLHPKVKQPEFDSLYLQTQPQPVKTEWAVGSLGKYKIPGVAPADPATIAHIEQAMKHAAAADAAAREEKKTPGVHYVRLAPLDEAEAVESFILIQMGLKKPEDRELTKDEYKLYEALSARNKSLNQNICTRVREVLLATYPRGSDTTFAVLHYYVRYARYLELGDGKSMQEEFIERMMGEVPPNTMYVSLEQHDHYMMLVKKFTVEVLMRAANEVMQRLFARRRLPWANLETIEAKNQTLKYAIRYGDFVLMKLGGVA